jgi:Transposase DDE domain
LGEPETLLADTGYFSAANVAACEKAEIDPLIAMGRQPHHPPLAERFEQAPLAPENPSPVEAMAHRLKTPEGRKLCALRKQTPEPVFGVIKSPLGFHQFSLRGLEKVRGEWSLVTIAWNLKRMFVLAAAKEARRDWTRKKHRGASQRRRPSCYQTRSNSRRRSKYRNRRRKSSAKLQSDRLLEPRLEKKQLLRQSHQRADGRLSLGGRHG